MKTLYPISLILMLAPLSLISVGQNKLKNKIYTNPTEVYDQPLIINSTISEIIKNKPYPLYDNKPTTSGIDQYVLDQTETVIFDFQKFFNVSTENVDFITDNLERYNNDESIEDDENLKTIPKLNTNIELGNFDPLGDYITITNKPVFLGYSLKTTDKTITSNIQQSNRFVRSTMIHEYAHAYFKQLISEFKRNKLPVNIEYYNKFSTNIGAIFIEEGIAEYCPTMMNELINESEIYKPKTIKEILDKTNKYTIFYKYGTLYVETFLKTNGLYKGIEILVTNEPPTENEIINPEIFFNKLK